MVGLTGVIALLLGVWGFWLQAVAAQQPRYLLDTIFQAIQLFVLQTSVSSPMPWQLNVARWLAPVVAGYTAIQALSELLADEFLALRLRLFFRGHIVICGLGRKGLNLARGFLERGQKVVVIEQDAENDYIRECRELGGLVLLGDATEQRLLIQAAVSKASCLLALCGDDGVNAEIAVAAAQLFSGQEGKPLRCVLHIVDSQLCDLLAEHQFDSTESGRLRLEFFNTFDVGARALLAEHPLSVSSKGGQVAAGRLVIIGVGQLGESLLINAARQWLSLGVSSNLKLEVTMVDRNASRIAEALRARYPGLDPVCSLHPLDMDVQAPAFQNAEFLRFPCVEGTLSKIFICFDDDSLGLRTALEIARHEGDLCPTIVVRMSQEAGLGELLRSVQRGSGGLDGLRAFALLDRTCQPDQVLHGTHDVLARAIHEAYVRQQGIAGVSPAQNVSMVSWESLPEYLKESNRQQADDIGVKLKAVNCRAVPLLDREQPPAVFTPEEIELLSRMEHDRWMAAKLEEGWRLGVEKSTRTKTHPSLVPYDDLPSSEQDKDRNAVIQIPEMLNKVGFRACRCARLSSRC